MSQNNKTLEPRTQNSRFSTENSNLRCSANDARSCGLFNTSRNCLLHFDRRSVIDFDLKCEHDTRRHPKYEHDSMRPLKYEYD